MTTKAYHAFKQKLFYFDYDLDLIDVLCTSVRKGELSDEESKFVLRNVDPKKHISIVRRQNRDTSRTAVMNHLRATLYSGYVKDVYEEVTHYLRTVLEKAAENGFDAGRIIGEHSFKLDARAVLATGNWAAVATLIADSVFQSLEAEQSTLKLLQKVSIKLNLGVSDALIDAALPYLEVRHFLVHTDGLLTSEFIKKNKKIKTRKRYVQLDFKFVAGMREAVKELVEEFDKKVIAANLLKPKDLHP